MIKKFNSGASRMKLFSLYSIIRSSFVDNRFTVFWPKIWYIQIPDISFRFSLEKMSVWSKMLTKSFVKGRWLFMKFISFWANVIAWSNLFPTMYFTNSSRSFNCLIWRGYSSNFLKQFRNVWPSPSPLLESSRNTCHNRSMTSNWLGWNCLKPP